MSIQYVPPTALGQGVNTFLNEGLSTALTIEATSNIDATIVSDVNVCTSATQVFQEIDLTLSGNVVMPGWSASAKAQLVESTNMTSTSVTIAVHSAVVLGTQSVTRSRLGFTPTNRETFFSSYGDSFVSSITTGAQYIALYTFYTSSTTEQIELVAQINAMNLEFNGSLQAALNSLTSNATVNWQLHQEIFGMKRVALPAPENLVAFALGFALLPVNAATVLAYGTSGYETTSNPPWLNTSPIVQNRVRFLSVVAGEIAALALIANAFQNLKSIYSAYRYTDPTIVGPLSMLTGDLITAATYLNGPTGVGVNPTVLVPVPTFRTLARPDPLPVPAFSIRQVNFPPNIGELGPQSTFGLDIDGDWVARITLPLHVALFHDGLGCTGINIMYVDAAGMEHSESGGSGNPDKEIAFQPGEVIASISGTARGLDAFGHLTITTSLGTSITSGNPAAPGTPFNWSFGADAAFLGFSGTTGAPLFGGLAAFIVNLSVHSVVFAPANWQALPSTAPVTLAQPNQAAKAA